MDVRFENLCRLFIEQAEVGIGWADINGLVKYLNPVLTNMLGLTTPEEIYDKPVFQFYEPDTISELEDHILATVMEKGVWNGKLLLKPKNGECYNTLNYLFAMKDERNKLFSFGNIVIKME